MLAAMGADRPPAVAADALALPLRTDAFDVVVAAFSINHLVDPAAGLREASRVTRPDGAILASAYAHDDAHPAKQAVEEAARALGWAPPAWYEAIRAEAVPQLATAEGMEAAAREADSTPRSRRSTSPFPSSERPTSWRGGWAWPSWRPSSSAFRPRPASSWSPMPWPASAPSIPRSCAPSSCCGPHLTGRSASSELPAWATMASVAPRRLLAMADVDGGEVVDNVAASRFELTVDGHTAELVYRLDPPVLELVHTGVPDALEGEGVGGRLVRSAVELAERDGLTIVPTCAVRPRMAAPASRRGREGAHRRPG